MLGLFEGFSAETLRAQRKLLSHTLSQYSSRSHNLDATRASDYSIDEVCQEMLTNSQVIDKVLDKEIVEEKYEKIQILGLDTLLQTL